MVIVKLCALDGLARYAAAGAFGLCDHSKDCPQPQSQWDIQTRVRNNYT